MLARLSLHRCALLAAPLAALAVAGCGGDGDQPQANVPGSDGGQVLDLTADPSGKLQFSPSSLTARPGRVRLVMDNPSTSGEEHGVAIDGNGIDKDGPVVAPGGISMLTVTLKRGTYRFYCPFDSHAQGGMTGTLTVR